MQFVSNGPYIPDSLLQHHDEGNVIFFCGAGVSYPAGLPGFKGLVEKIYKELGASRNALEERSFQQKQYDLTLSLLEQRIPGERLAVRNALATVLRPKRLKNGAIDTHLALLDLSRGRDGTVKVVTTNFDRNFERAISRTKRRINSYVAPMLPVPKNSRWNGVTYLHGLLPKRHDETSLHRLVFTSGDFGIAYLTERWAARFVSELFRNYVVCFVGYSIDDPVMRYMMDALAADRLQGEKTPDAYAFGEYKQGEEEESLAEWKAKGVIPILYDPANNHAALHSTLGKWAETWRQGTLGRERIVGTYAIANPSMSTVQDNFVGRMLWALEDQSGFPAKLFAEYNPVPSLDWLTALSDRRYAQQDLSRFNVFNGKQEDRELKFSMVYRPAPHSHAPWMSLSTSAQKGSQWDRVMTYIAQWLVRHLNDPKLIHWLADNGGGPGPIFNSQISFELDRISKLEHEQKHAELTEIRNNAPNGIPSINMRKIWRLLLSDHVKLNTSFIDIYSWGDRVKREGMNMPLRLEMRNLLAPKVRFKRPFLFGEEGEESAGEPNIKQLVDWDLVLSADHVTHYLSGTRNDFLRPHLPGVLPDLQQLLLDALDLLRELGAADSYRDRSTWDMPSIEHHHQNRRFRDWVALIELLRDAWLETNDVDAQRASAIALSWFHFEYPLFKRLGFFAAANGDLPTKTWLNWLLLEDAKWLWSIDTRREVMRLIVQRGASLDMEDQLQLEETILKGPGEAHYSGLTPSTRQYVSDELTWIFLKKLEGATLNLGTVAAETLFDISKRQPNLKLHKYEREEFSSWMSGTGDPDYEEDKVVDIAPREQYELISWLKENQGGADPFATDTWVDYCRQHPLHSITALIALGNENIWPQSRWRGALQAWSEKKSQRRLLPHIVDTLNRMPDLVLKDLAHAASWWVQTTSKFTNLRNLEFIRLCKRLLALDYETPAETIRNGEVIEDPVGTAINHPIGHVIQALLDLWFKDNPNDKDGLPQVIEPLFTMVCDINFEKYRHGRVLLSSRLIALSRVDEKWTTDNLLPLLSWEDFPFEARGMWEGFLWSPRLYWRLLELIKFDFLETSKHYDKLGDHGNQYSTFITYAALHHPDSFSQNDFARAIQNLPESGLHEVAQALVQALLGASAQKEIYWKESIHPFLHNIWPKSKALATPAISALFARLSIATGDEFPHALGIILGWLRAVDYPSDILGELSTSGLTEKFPMDSLKLLDMIVGGSYPWWISELQECLSLLKKSAPIIVSDPRFERLNNLSRK